MLSVPELVDKLQLDLTRKTSSFAEYLTMCSPYVPSGAEPLWDLLLHVRDEERVHARLLGRAIVEHNGIPSPGAYDEGSPDANYLHIFYLYDLLIRSKEASIRVFESRAEETRDYPAAHKVIQSILDDERRQLRELRDCLMPVRSNSTSQVEA